MDVSSCIFMISVANWGCFSGLTGSPPLFLAKRGNGKCGSLTEQLLGNIDPEWNGQDAKNGAC